MHALVPCHGAFDFHALVQRCCLCYGHCWVLRHGRADRHACDPCGCLTDPPAFSPRRCCANRRTEACSLWMDAKKDCAWPGMADDHAHPCLRLVARDAFHPRGHGHGWVLRRAPDDRHACAPHGCLTDPPAFSPRRCCTNRRTGACSRCIVAGKDCAWPGMADDQVRPFLGQAAWDAFHLGRFQAGVRNERVVRFHAAVPCHGVLPCPL